MLQEDYQFCLDKLIFLVVKSFDLPMISYEKQRQQGYLQYHILKQYLEGRPYLL